jgi:hypothetical protein
MATRLLTVALCALALLVAAAPVLAKPGSGSGGGGDDARAAGRCGGGGSWQLRLSSHDGDIRVEFEVTRRRAREAWRVVFVHERRVAWRGTVRTSRSGAFGVRRSYADYEGADTVTARATGPRGITCRASATLQA